MAVLEWGGGSVSSRVCVAILVGAVAVTLSGCGVRLEGDPPAFPSPDEVTVARDSLADAVAGIVEAAGREGADADEVAVGASDAAAAHLEVLGGVYVAYPSASPSSDDDATTSPTLQPTLSDAVATAREIAATVAATTADADLAFLARSMDLEWALRELWAVEEATAAQAEAEAATASAAPTAPPTGEADATDETPGDADPRWFPLADGSINFTAGFVPTATTGVASTGLAQETLTVLALKEDEARFAYETLAAQEFGPRRTDALGRSRLHAERSDTLATLLDADPRTPLYQVRDTDLLDPDSRRSLERSLEADLAWRYAALLDGASADDAAWLLNASFDAYARAMRTDGFTAADVPTLPGLTVIP
ncbi:DUF4439 domain-containing protein [Demequina sp.]|uniref:DUF4439 domain-containing protein n=1 Tax=Demequina sp. TaxID=2050685 RepID=UPI0025BC7EF1|nr:DUF4439 domain-containing protein [Demequina sp.]